MGKKHGKYLEPEYKIFYSMKSRCYNPKCNYYNIYGGRGIQVCDRWLDIENGFKNFYNDMGPRPGKEYSIDRINNGGDYVPENCRWATLEEQANNKRTNRILEFNDKKQTATQWVKETGIPFKTLTARLDVMGWSIEKSLTTPVIIKNKLINFQGESKTLQEWSKYLNITFSTLQSRIYHYNWPIDKVLSTPIRGK